jgi:hypothetical protein
MRYAAVRCYSPLAAVPFKGMHITTFYALSILIPFDVHFFSVPLARSLFAYVHHLPLWPHLSPSPLTLLPSFVLSPPTLLVQVYSAVETVICIPVRDYTRTGPGGFVTSVVRTYCRES